MLKNTPKKWIEDEHIHQGRLGKVNCATIISDAAHYIRVHLAAGIQPQLGIHRDRPKPENALIPVSQEVVVFNTAPEDIDAILEIADAVDAAILLDDYPAARALLYGLMSELRVRTYNLPLATYPVALTEAARLLDEKKNDEARMVLMVALSTSRKIASLSRVFSACCLSCWYKSVLGVACEQNIDRVTPLPLLLAREAINEAEAQRNTEKDSARELLDTARYELDRAMALGYAKQDPEYKALKDEISNLQKQLKTNEDTSSLFSRLKERLSAFLKRQSTGKQSRQVESQRQKSEREKRAA